jgi:general secretion pathway protein A
MKSALSALYGLKHNPFTSDIPTDALCPSANVDRFCWRMEQLVGEGGFSMITGDVGTGKSCALRLLERRLVSIRDVVIGVLAHPQSRVSDFYRELGDVFGVTLSASNRWGSFKSLREKWHSHIESTLWRPVLLIDEAQEVLPVVLNELRILSSTKFDSQNVLTVCLAGDDRLVEKLQSPELLPLSTRIKTRLRMNYSTPQELRKYLEHALQVAGNPHLMSEELINTLCERAAGNLRVLCNTGAELLANGVKRELKQLDEKLYLELFDVVRSSPRQPAARRKSA